MSIETEGEVVALEQALKRSRDDYHRLLDTWQSLFGERTVTEVYQELLLLRRQGRALTVLYEALDEGIIKTLVDGGNGSAVGIARKAVAA